MHKEINHSLIIAASAVTVVWAIGGVLPFPNIIFPDESDALRIPLLHAIHQILLNDEKSREDMGAKMKH